MSTLHRPTRAAELLQALRRRLSERGAVPRHAAPAPLDIDLDLLTLQALRRTMDVDTAPAVLQRSAEGQALPCDPARAAGR